MPEYSWFSINPPRGCTLGELTAMLRPLANRPQLGMTGVTPLVVFEVWSIRGKITYVLGADVRIAKALPVELRAQLDRLGLTPIKRTVRPAVLLAADVRLTGVSAPLRLDTAPAVSAAVLAELRELNDRQANAVVQWTLGPAQPRGSQPVPFNLAASLGLRAADKPNATSARLWREKAGTEPLFAVLGRIGATAATPALASGIIRRLGNALKLSSSQHAALRLGKASPGRAHKLREVTSPLTWSVMNAAELAGVLGWPLEINATDDLPVLGGHINAVPAALRGPEEAAADRSGERVLGESLHPAERGQLVRVPVSTSLHHLELIGPTGSGKSTLLASWIVADIAAGRSVFVIEPRGDLINDVLARLPASRRNRVVVIEPGQKRAVGVNVLAGDRTDAERRADETVHLLGELHGDNLGPRSTDIALHSILTASRLPGGTLCDVPILLTNPAFRRKALAQVSDPLVLGPWWVGFDALSEAERAQHVMPLMNKLRAFLSRDPLRRMLGQSEPRFRLDDVFTEPGTMVLVNLNRGLLGTPSANLLGALILSQAWSAIQRRAALAPERRHPVMMVVDEFQDYLRLPGGLDFGDALAQSRGLAVSWTLAHQHLDQLNASQRAAAFANARSRVAFRPAPGDAKPLAAAMGGDLTGEDLLRLRAFEACCQLHLGGQPTRAFSVRTRPLSPWVSEPDEVRRISAERYGVDGDELDKALTARWQGSDAPPEGPVGVRRRRSA